MNKRILNTWVLAALAILYLMIFAVAKSNAEDFIFDLREVYDRPATDVNKPRIPGFDKTCCHAAVANAISFSTGGDQKVAIQIYLDFVRAIGNTASRASDIWDVGMDKVDAPRNFSRYNSITYIDNRLNRLWEELITSMLHAGWVILVTVKVPDQVASHIFTVYGYVWVEGSDNTKLIYCDSDDGFYGTQVGDMLPARDGGSSFRFSDGQICKIEGFYAVQVKGKIE